MAAYFLFTSITATLPDQWDSVLSTPQQTAIVTRASARTDDLFPDYMPFPAIGGTPATPQAVQEIAELLGLAEAYRVLGVAGFEISDDSAELERRAVEKASRYAAGGTAVIARVTATDEVIAWGSNTWYPVDHVFAAGAYEVIRGSVRITGYRNGIDFDVLYRPEIRAWTMTCLNGAIVNGTKVSYEYSYERHREIERPGIDSIRMELC
jgi:hypothetical protein